MKIAAVRTTIVSVPFTADEVWAYGRRRGITNLLVEVETGDGLVGLGEAVGWPTPEVAERVLEAATPVVIGHDAFRIEELMRRLYAERGWHYFRNTAGCALAGLEMALWDLVGKASELPLHVLFGGALRERVPYYWYVAAAPPDRMAAAAREGVERGFSSVYLKVGFADGGSLETVRLVREAIGPDVALRVDANEAWRAGEAVAAIRKLEPLGLEFVEQPVNMYDLDALAEVQERTSVPLAANQSSWDEFATVKILARGIASVIVTDPHQLGGLQRFKKVAAMAEIADMPVVKHSFGDLGVSTLACAHVLATCQNAGLAHQTHYQLLDQDVIRGGPPTFESGGIAPPDAPGIGVEIDRERVEEFAGLYRRKGFFSPYEPHAR